MLEEASPTISEPSPDRAWASASLPSRTPRSTAPIFAVQTKLRVQPPNTWQRGSDPDKKYLPMMTAPSAEIPTASVCLPNSGGDERISKLGVGAATAVPTLPKTTNPTQTNLSTGRTIRYLPCLMILLGDAR